jgi:hypothetical protein
MGWFSESQEECAARIARERDDKVRRLQPSKDAATRTRIAQQATGNYADERTGKATRLSSADQRAAEKLLKRLAADSREEKRLKNLVRERAASPKKGFFR